LGGFVPYNLSDMLQILDGDWPTAGKTDVVRRRFGTQCSSHEERKIRYVPLFRLIEPRWLSGLGVVQQNWT
jgi:hypothetical protein